MEKRFVDAFDVHTKKKVYLSTKDICVHSGLYTLPTASGKDPYTLEKYYATHVDDIYPEVYRLLLDKTQSSISNRQKHKILNTVLSLYFRTPKFLNASNRMVDEIFEDVLAKSSNATIELNFLGKPLIFLRSNVEEVKNQLKEENRQMNVYTQLEKWKEFVNYKYSCAISVFELEGDIELITGDNPVNVHSAIQNPFDLFDPTNIIQVPLDRKHFLYVYPNTEAAPTSKINRGVRDKLFALTSNLQTERSAERWVIGFPGTVEKHFLDQIKYGQENEENLKLVADMKMKAEKMGELLKVAQSYGVPSYKFANKVKELRKLDCFKGNHDLDKIVLELAKSGFLTV